MERHKERKAAGLEKHAYKKKKKKKIVEQHFDDCGDDLSSRRDVRQLTLLSELQDDFSSDGRWSEEEPDEEPAPGHNAVQSAVQCSLLGSDADPELLPHCRRSYHAVDLYEFMSLLSQRHDHWGIDVMEICGGEARVTT